MKNTKRIASLLLALVMVLAMTTVAFAEGEAYQYEIYQIFTGNFEDNVLTDVKWGANGTGTAESAVDSAVLEALEAVASATTNSEKLDIIDDYVNFSSTPIDTLATNDTTASVDGLATGYYLVKDVDGTQDGENQAYTAYVVQVVDGTLTINRKASYPEVDKVIVDNGEVTENEVSIGETVNYKFTGTIASNIAEYDSYYYVFTDTMDKGLTYTNNVAVTVNGVDVTEYFYIDATDYDEANGTTLTVGIDDLLALELLMDGEDAVVGEITPATEVVVTYTAVLNENAVVGTVGNMNKVYLTYSNNPNDDADGDKATTPPPENPEDEPETTNPTGNTPESKVYTYTTELVIIKVDEEGNRLTGAAFKIEGTSVNKVVVTTESFVEDANGTYYKLTDGSYTEEAPDGTNDAAYASTTVKYTKTTTTEVKDVATDVSIESYVGDDGVLKFTGLGTGTYVITETQTPEGYNSIEPLTVKIDWLAEGDDCTWIYTGTTEYVEDQDGDPVYTNVLKITNFAGTTLPETGGMGTTIFYIIGGVLVVAAFVLLVTKKRMSVAE